MGKTVTLTLAVEDARLLRTLLDEALRPAPPVVQRVSVETYRDIFDALSNNGEEFDVVFEKLDGSWREMRARVVGPIQFNYGKRESYANVIDLDLFAESRGSKGPAVSAERKIVLNRVKRLEVGGFVFVPSGR